MKSVLVRLFEGKPLDRAEARRAMDLVLSGTVGPEQTVAFLSALQVRKETAEELAGFLEALRAKAIPVSIQRDDLIDTCGTGGDGAQTFNISTAAAFIVAGAGVGVAKHGNRSVSSKCGSADVWEALGIYLPQKAVEAVAQIEKANLGFFFAPAFHPGLGKITPLRRAMEVRTAFNILGPLANPANVRRQVVGVYDPTLIKKLADVLLATGTVEAMVISAEEGMDEFSLSGNTKVAHLKNGKITELVTTPEDFGVVRAKMSTLVGGDGARNADIISAVLTGAELGPQRDVVVMNAAAALVVSGKAATFKDGAALAGHTIDAGRAYSVLKKLREMRP